jgi:hypothetical protein
MELVGLAKKKDLLENFGRKVFARHVKEPETLSGM